MANKYRPLTEWLTAQSGDRVVCTFAQLEQVLGDRLPASARDYRAWWANQPDHHMQAQAWLGAGWVVRDINLTAETVTFARRQPSREQATVARRIASMIRRRFSTLAPADLAAACRYAAAIVAEPPAGRAAGEEPLPRPRRGRPVRSGS